MKKKTNNGKSINAENRAIVAKSIPKISQIIDGLNERDSMVVYAILEKKPGMTWEQVAKGLGITRRQLFNLRREQRIQESVRNISRDFLICDLPDVFKALAKKAKKGETSAMRIFFELAGEFEPEALHNQKPSDPMTEWINLVKTGRRNHQKKLESGNSDELQLKIEK